MAERTLSPLFTWRSAVASKESKLAPTLRHVALTLSLHMSERGDSCFPSMETQVEETGLGLSTVRDSLRRLHRAGWLIREVSHGRGRSNRYQATIPGTYRQELALSKTAEIQQENRQIDPVKPPAPGYEDVHLESDKEGASAKNGASTHKTIFDALISAIYPAGASLTAGEKRKVSLAANGILAAGGTPEQVIDTAARYKRHQTYGQVAMTAKSLEQHWGELAVPVRAASAQACAECEMGGGRHADGCSRASS